MQSTYIKSEIQATEFRHSVVRLSESQWVSTPRCANRREGEESRRCLVMVRPWRECSQRRFSRSVLWRRFGDSRFRGLTSGHGSIILNSNILSFKYMKTTKRYGKKAGIALDLWVKLARAFGTFSNRALDDIRRYGLTQPQFGIVEILGHLGPLTLGEIAKKQLSSCGNTTVVVDNLEKEGLVLRKPCKEDRRAMYLHLTPKGEQIFQEMFRHHAQHITKLASVLTEKEQQQLAGLLKKLGLGLKDIV